MIRTPETSADNAQAVRQVLDGKGEKGELLCARLFTIRLSPVLKRKGSLAGSLKATDDQLVQEAARRFLARFELETEPESTKPVGEESQAFLKEPSIPAAFEAETTESGAKSVVAAWQKKEPRQFRPTENSILERMKARYFSS